MTTTQNGTKPYVDSWPQGQHPYGHHDPDWWLCWRLYPARWLLCCESTLVSIDLWGCEESAWLSEVLTRVQAIRPLLDDQEALGLERALDDIYRPRQPWIQKEVRRYTVQEITDAMDECQP